MHPPDAVPFFCFYALIVINSTTTMIKTTRQKHFMITTNTCAPFPDIPIDSGASSIALFLPTYDAPPFPVFGLAYATMLKRKMPKGELI